MFSFRSSHSTVLKGLIFGLALLFCVVTAHAYGPKTYNPSEKSNEKPKALEGIGIDEKLGQTISKDTEFYNEAGDIVTIGSLIKPDRPSVLSIVYYDCPSLCNFHLNGIVEVINKLKKTVGKDFDLIAVSMEPKEGPEMASDKKDAYLTQYKRPGAENGWHFLTGTKENIQKLTGEVGFKFQWDDETKQYAHSSAAIVISPEGKITRYLHGIVFDQNSFNLALIEGSKGKIGNIVDQLVMYCFQYDPKAKKYSLYIFNIVRIFALAVVLILAMFLIPAWLKGRNKQTPA